MVTKCSACGKYVSAADVASCSVCKRVNHRSCVNVARTATITGTWKCPDCKTSPARNDDKDMPAQATKCHSRERDDQQNSRSSATTELDSELTVELRKFRDEMRITREEFRAARLEMQELRERFDAFQDRLCRLEDRVTALEGQAAEKGADRAQTDVVRTLEATVSQLQLDLNNRDQEILRNDIEISGIPEENGENTTHMVLAVSQKLGITLDERELVSCMRVGVARATDVPTPGGVARAVRSRPIVVRLARRATRDALLRAARVRRHLNTDGLGLRDSTQHKPFYLNERLTRVNRALFNRARTARRECGWRYVWTREGQVLARKDHEAPIQRIRVETDLVRVFGCAHISQENKSPL